MVLNYDTQIFDFQEQLKAYLEVEDLSKLHETKDFDVTKVLTRENDTKTKYHKAFYRLFELGAFRSTYNKFIMKYMGDVLYQTIPNIRFHFPNNVGVGEFHKDSDFGHDINEINYIIPLTDMWGTNSVWVEEYPNQGFYHPMRLNLGDFIQFSGATLKHGSKINDTDYTRVSFDFRTIKKEHFIPGKETINGIKKFEVGSYWSDVLQIVSKYL